MAPMTRTYRRALFSPRSGAWTACAGLLVAFAIGSCTDGIPEAAEAPTLDSPQLQEETQPNQLPLPALMRGLERDMAAVAAGLWMEDLRAVAEAAHRVAEHPSTTLEYRQAIQEALGDHFPTFVEYDQEVHHAARVLAERAEAGASIAELLGLQHEVARGCIGCHTDFRNRLEPTMDRLRSDEP
jgi:hypothetical protein